MSRNKKKLYCFLDTIEGWNYVKKNYKNYKIVICTSSPEILFKKNIKEEIIIEKKKAKTIVKKQKEITTIKILNKTLDQLIQDFDKPNLIRQDGNTKVVRFDTSSCRLFVYFNSMIKKSRVEYYEIRNEKGELLNKKEKINICFQEIQKT